MENPSPPSPSVSKISQQKGHHYQTPRKRRWLTAVWAILIFIVLLFVVALILALTVFKMKQPTTKLLSASVEGISPRLTLPAFHIDLNLTLNLKLLVKNRNHASFRHGPGTSVLLYRGKEVGQADLFPGFIRAMGSTTLPCRLTMEVDKLASKVTTLISDVLRGEVVMETRTRIPGRISFLGIFKKHVVTSSDCQVAVGFPAMKIRRQDCKFKNKL